MERYSVRRVRVYFEVIDPRGTIANCFKKARNSLGRLKFNRHFLKSIFDLLTLNRFLNGFLRCTRGGPKITNFFQHPTDPLTQLLFFWFPPLWSYFALRELRHPKLCQTRYFSTALDIFDFF